MPIPKVHDLTGVKKRLKLQVWTAQSLVSEQKLLRLLTKIGGHDALLAICFSTRNFLADSISNVPEKGVTMMPMSAISNGTLSSMICHLKSGT